MSEWKLSDEPLSTFIYSLNGNGSNLFCANVQPGYNDDGGRTYIDELHKIALLMRAAPDLLEAVKDLLSGWKYIRETHGDLYGVGWDRAQNKAEEAIAKAIGAE